MIATKSTSSYLNPQLAFQIECKKKNCFKFETGLGDDLELVPHGKLLCVSVARHITAHSMFTMRKMDSRLVQAKEVGLRREWT